jgi:hypothetical protein
VQQLAREMRRHAAANGGGALPTTRLLQLYLAAEAREGALDAATHTITMRYSLINGRSIYSSHAEGLNR